jgi:hypothetical protein
VLTEAGDIPVTDPFGDASDGEARGAEEFAGFFEAPFLARRRFWRGAVSGEAPFLARRRFWRGG